MRFLPWLLAWAGTLVVAAYLGRQSVESPPAGEPSSGAYGEADGARAPRGEAGAGPRLEAAPGTPRGGSSGSAGSGRPGDGGRLRGPRVEVVPADAPLDLAGAGTLDELLARLYAYAAAQLAVGPEGHKALYRTLDRLLREDEALRRFLRSEEDLAPHLYGLLRFLMDRDAQVVDLTETLLRVAAEEPAFFEGADGDTLELVTEGVGPLLPGMVGPERLERLRALAQRALRTPAEQQPQGLRSARGNLERLLAAWTPRLPSREAAARLAAGGLEPREALALLRQVAPGDRGALDLLGLLGPLVETGDPRVLRADVLQGLAPRDQAALDQRLLAAAPSLRLTEWHLRTYLEASGRSTWDAAGPFLTDALSRGGTLADLAALTLVQLRVRPSAEVVSGLLRSHTLSARVAEHLRGQFGLR